MFELKPLSRQGIASALDKVERYRLLNEPRMAESICLDILAVDPANQPARVALLLARTDQFTRPGGPRIDSARELLDGLDGEYERQYYTGLVNERWAEAIMTKGNPGSGPDAYAWFRKAMEFYERAEALRPAGNEDAILRWNTCARLIDGNHNLAPLAEDDFHPLLE